ncbi:MAG: hypothetical protein NUV57_05000 [archaeon]|nr:hypothetical protein [archaeon]
MASKAPAIALGIIFYVLGAAGANVFFPELKISLMLSPTIELLIVALGVFFLSALFYGRTGFITMLFAGIIIGGHFQELPVYALTALMPLLFGLIGGTNMGETAKLDLKGKKNFFEETEAHLAYILVIIVTSILVGFLFGVQTEIPFQELL